MEKQFQEDSCLMREIISNTRMTEVDFFTVCYPCYTRDLKIRGREDLGRLPEVNLTFDTCARVPTAQLIPVLLS